MKRTPSHTPGLASDSSTDNARHLTPRTPHAWRRAAAWSVLPMLGALAGMPSEANAYSVGITSNKFSDPAKGCNNSGCHNSGTAPVVSLEANGLTVAPGAAIDLEMKNAGTDTQKFAGFNVSTTVGVFSSVGSDPNVQIKTNTVNSRGEATHKAKIGTPASFRFRWTAPTDFTSAVLVGWSNAVNGNGGTSGDLSATTSITVTACADGDGDGAYPTTCIGGTDCDDADGTLFPAQTETCDDKDNNCNGEVDEGLTQTWYTDLDHDGYGETSSSTVSCNPPPSTSQNPGDCDDEDPDANPGVVEGPLQCEDGIDQDCSGTDLGCSQSDQDGDGQSGADGDCNDDDNTIFQGANEIPYDGIDQDCSGKDLTDVDGDTFDGEAAGGDDCNDEDAEVNPGEGESADEKDNDCDGTIDEGTTLYDDDGDGVTDADGDCNDADNSISPTATEICEDGIDQDCKDGDLACEPEATPTAAPTEAPTEAPTTPPGDDSGDEGTGCGCTNVAPRASFGALGMLVGALAFARFRRRPTSQSPEQRKQG